MTQAIKQSLRVEFRTPANGKLGRMAFDVLDGLKVHHTDTVNPQDAKDRKRAAKEMATVLDKDAEEMQSLLTQACNETVERYRQFRTQAEAGSTEAAPHSTAELLDFQPEAIRRPLCLVNGRAYAAAWVEVKTETNREVDPKTGMVANYDPPLVRVEDRLLVVRDDGQVFVEGGGVPGAHHLADLGLLVYLPAPVQPGRGWSGAGVKRYQAGERPTPSEVFKQVSLVFDTFLDFSRSLAEQQTMCELAACYVLATYLLDALQVVGYPWPNGESGSGKTTFLQVATELAYLGRLILAGSSYPTLRDLADYGATLAFDDAEAVMDIKRTDPDKRTLLLAGNRRGATIAVKELVGDRWVTRHISTFCPRLFSAIRLPDQVLGSRCIIVPLVRSGDTKRSKASPMDPACWPCDRQRLIDDLWALGLANLPFLPEHDREAANESELSGRPLEPWRSVLAVAHWLEQEGIAGLLARMNKVSMAYQQEREGYEEGDTTRVLFRALLELTEGRNGSVPLSPGTIAQRMNTIATEEDLAEPDKTFTNARRVGWLLKRQRFKRGDRSDRSKTWHLVRSEVEAAARAYGVVFPPSTAIVTAEEEQDDSGPSPFP